MDGDVEDLDPGGGGSKGIGALHQGGSDGGVAFRVRDVGPDPRMERALRNFHHRVARRLTGWQPRRWGGGGGGIPRWRQL